MRRLAILALLLLTGLSARAQTFRFSGAISCTTGTSCTITPATSPLAGSAMSIGITWGNANVVTITSVTDTQSDHYTHNSPQECTLSGAFGDFCGQIFVACNIAGGSTAITVNFSGTAVGGAGLFTMTTGEISATATSCFDQSNGNNQTLGASGTFSSPAMTTTHAKEIIIGLGKIDNGSTTPGPSFTGMTTTVPTVTMEYRNVTVTGSYSAVFTNGNSGPVVALGVTLIGGGSSSGKRKHVPFIIRYPREHQCCPPRVSRA